MVTLFLIRPMCKYEIRACQRDVSKSFEEEEWNEYERKEEQDGRGLPWLASSKLESLKHSGNFFQVTLTSLCLHGRGKLPTLSP